jgi:hypothetical protein
MLAHLQVARACNREGWVHGYMDTMDNNRYN